MTLYVLDTDHASLAQHDHPQISRRVMQTDPGSLAVTIITAEEQLRGWFSQIRRHKSGERLVWAYTGFKATLDALARIQVLSFDRAALSQYERLQQERIRIGTQDLRIAAIVLAVDGVLATRNRRDFVQVPGLVIEDWTQP